MGNEALEASDLIGEELNENEGTDNNPEAHGEEQRSWAADSEDDGQSCTA